MGEKERGLVLKVWEERFEMKKLSFGKVQTPITIYALLVDKAYLLTVSEMRKMVHPMLLFPKKSMSGATFIPQNEEILTKKKEKRG